MTRDREPQSCAFHGCGNPTPCPEHEATRDLEPRKLRADVRRDPHRSTVFVISFDIGDLIDEHGRPTIAGDELERTLLAWCERGIRQTLAEARAKVVGHP